MQRSSRSTRVAAFDIGSNSIKMTVATVDDRGTVDETISAVRTVRLGEGIDRTGLLKDDRMAAALETLTEMAARARRAGAQRLIGVATEALRVTANGPAFLDRVSDETGIDIALISGDKEAALAYAGLASLRPLNGEIVMADIGGASTEVVHGDGETVRWAHSVPLGSGRLTDAHVTADPPTGAELDACRAGAAELLTPLGLERAGGAHLIVAGGTGEYLRQLTGHIEQFTPAEVDEVLRRLTALTADELADALDIAPIRARVLPAGIVIVAELAAQLAPVGISAGPSGLRAGLLLAAARGAER